MSHLTSAMQSASGRQGTTLPRRDMTFMVSPWEGFFSCWRCSRACCRCLAGTTSLRKENDKKKIHTQHGTKWSKAIAVVAAVVHVVAAVVVHAVVVDLAAVVLIAVGICYCCWRCCCQCCCCTNVFNREEDAVAKQANLDAPKYCRLWNGAWSVLANYSANHLII